MEIVILGIDGCKNGWVAIQLGQDGQLAGAMTAPSLEELFQNAPQVAVAGVDMPLHLLDAPIRPTDRLARGALGSERGRSVFPALPRFAIEEAWIKREFDAVNQECRARYGRAFSRQSLALRSKIAEVNAAFANGHPVIEVHPELSFTAMNNGVPLQFSKKCWGGLQERLGLLERSGIVLGDDLPTAVGRLPADDIIDAAAAAWSAHRYLHGSAESLPAQPTGPTEPAIWV